MEPISPLFNCKIYTIHGIEMIHIAEFAQITHRSIQSTRHLINEGNVVRKMKFFRDRSRLMIPTKEIYGYPLVLAGHTEFNRAIYHYAEVQQEDGSLKFERVLCKQCSYGEMCDARKTAEELIVPEGDK